MSAAHAYAAVDVGAESGRVVVGRLGNARVELEEVHRFSNRPVRLPDGLRWDLLQLFGEALHGLAAARATAGQLDGVAVDAWGVDYALLDDRDRVLGLPFHYRDDRTRGAAERAFARVPAPELYGRTGIQAMPINTVFQLLADEDSAALGIAARIALVPDLLTSWLCGELANERTVASTTGLLEARSGEWASDLIARLGLPVAIFGRLVDPGTVLAPLLAHHDLGSPAVIATAAHDTAAAFAAAPGAGRGEAVLSSGTWSLLGLELPNPVLGEDAEAANLTNERGVEGTTRLLKNVMGLWLIQECRRTWLASGASYGYDELMRLAASSADSPVLFDPDREEFLAPGDMPTRIAGVCAESDQSLSGDPGAVVRSVLLSLACKYRFVLERIEEVAGQEAAAVNVIGGGARNSVLCGLTADVLGRPVKAGPFEAAALGNVLVQARATGAIGSLDEARALAAGSSSCFVHEPEADRAWAEETYQRFLTLTHLSTRPSVSLERSWD